jgi:hypothetical protein
MRFAWSLITLFWEAFAPSERKAREAWLVPRAQYEADCKALEETREEEIAA